MCFPADLFSTAWDATDSRKAAVTQGTRATQRTRVGAKVVVATRKQLTPLQGTSRFGVQERAKEKFKLFPLRKVINLFLFSMV